MKIKPKSSLREHLKYSFRKQSSPPSWRKDSFVDGNKAAILLKIAIPNESESNWNSPSGYPSLVGMGFSPTPTLW